MANSSVRSAPDMRGEICSRRNRAAVFAAEEENAGSSGGRPPVAARFPTLFAAGPAVDDARRREKAGPFYPEPIFIGPKAGWTGPALAAKPSVDAPAGPPDTARAYVNDKPPLAEGAETQGAPAALKGALKPVKLAPLAARPHRWAAAKLRKTIVAAKAKKPDAAPSPSAH